MNDRLQMKIPMPTSSIVLPKSQFSSCSLSRCGTHSEFVDSHGKSLALQPPLIQAKLTIGQPNDKYEQEADRVADIVMHMPEPKVQRQKEPEDEEEENILQTKPLADQITPLIQTQVEPGEEVDEEILQAKPLRGKVAAPIQRQVDSEEEEQEESIQSKPISNHSPLVTSAIQAQLKRINGGGQPLPRKIRNFFELKFGQNLSQVQVHTGAQVSKLAQALNAKAFTFGRDIFFGNEQYFPSRMDGRRLLAHELTHVVQQKNSTMQNMESAKRTIVDNRPLFRNISNIIVPEKKSTPLVAFNDINDQQIRLKKKQTQSKAAKTKQDRPKAIKKAEWEPPLEKEELHIVKLGANFAAIQIWYIKGNKKERIIGKYLSGPGTKKCFDKKYSRTVKAKISKTIFPKEGKVCIPENGKGCPYKLRYFIMFSDCPGKGIHSWEYKIEVPNPAIEKCRVNCKKEEDCINRCNKIRPIKIWKLTHIPGSVSHGCVRANEDTAIKIFDMTSDNIRVRFFDGKKEFSLFWKRQEESKRKGNKED